MAKEKFVSFRSDEEFGNYLRKLADDLGVIEGRKVSVSDLMWRIVDSGLPAVQEFVEQSLPESSTKMLHKKYQISAALRTTRSTLHILEQVSNQMVSS